MTVVNIRMYSNETIELIFEDQKSNQFINQNGIIEITDRNLSQTFEQICNNNNIEYLILTVNYLEIISNMNKNTNIDLSFFSKEITMITIKTTTQDYEKNFDIINISENIKELNIIYGEIFENRYINPLNVILYDNYNYLSLIKCKLTILISIPVQINKVRTTNCIPESGSTKISINSTEKININIFIRGTISPNVFRYWFPTKYLSEIESDSGTSTTKLEVKSEETQFRLKSLNNKSSDFYGIAIGYFNDKYYSYATMDLKCVINPIYFDRIYDNGEEVIFLSRIFILKKFEGNNTIEIKYWTNANTLYNGSVEYSNYNKYAVWLKEEAQVVMDPEDNKVQIIFEKFEVKSGFDKPLLQKYESVYYDDYENHRTIYILNLDISLFDVEPIKNPNLIEIRLRKYISYYFSDSLTSIIGAITYLKYSYNENGLVMEEIIDLNGVLNKKLPRVIDKVITFGNFNFNNNKIIPLEATTFINENKETLSFYNRYSIYNGNYTVKEQISVNQINRNSSVLVYVNLVVKGKIPEWLYKYLPLPKYIKYTDNGYVITDTETNIMLMSINALPFFDIGIDNESEENKCSFDLSKITDL